MRRGRKSQSSRNSQGLAITNTNTDLGYGNQHRLSRVLYLKSPSIFIVIKIGGFPSKLVIKGRLWCYLQSNIAYPTIELSRNFVHGGRQDSFDMKVCICLQTTCDVARYSFEITANYVSSDLGLRKILFGHLEVRKN